MGPLHCTKSNRLFIPTAKISHKMQEPAEDQNLRKTGGSDSLGDLDNSPADTDKESCDKDKKENCCSTSGGEQSCVSLSSDGDNGACPRNQPMSSSGYGSENLPSQLDKQQKKKRLQQCLKELKQLITKQTTPSQDVAQKLGTIEALTQALEILREKSNKEETVSSPPQQPECASKTVRSESDDHDLSLLPAEAAIFTGENGNSGSENSLSACNATVALPDGRILDVSENFLVFSGLSKEELVEHKRFTDLVEPQDRPLLVLTSLRACSFRPTQMSLFARLRQGSAKNILPCHLHCVLSSNEDGSHSTKISISPLISAYSEMAKERLSNVGFCIRHSVSCKFTFVDASSVPFLGWLPQDLLGHSLLKYIHKDDIPILFEAYEAMVKNHGNPIRSRPYRFWLYNTEFAVLETEWTIFLNPWTKKVDFVVGNCRVMEEPPINKDVFGVNPSNTDTTPISGTRLVGEELILTEQKFMNLLSQPIQTATKVKKSKHSSKSSSKGSEPKRSSPKSSSRVSPNAEQKLSTTVEPLRVVAVVPESSLIISAQSNQSTARKRKEMSVSAYVDNLVENMVIGSGAGGEMGVLGPGGNLNEPNPGFHGHAEGSPGGENSGGEELSGSSPPESSGSGPFSYSQINCMENVQRLLQSQPRTHSSNESRGNIAGDKSGENSKSNSTSPPHGEDLNSRAPQAAAIVHRSHSAIQLEDHPPMPLTRELLKQHTKKWEKEYKESWKRRFSEEITSPDQGGVLNPNTPSATGNNLSPLKRALETSAFATPEGPFCPEKMFRSEVHRPASMPVLSRPGNELFAAEWHQFLNSKAAEEYYRSLGPNPPPPPGRNVHISSAPLPPSTLGLNPENPVSPLTEGSPPGAHKSAFAPLIGRKVPDLSPWGLPPQNQPLNFSMNGGNARNPGMGTIGLGPGQRTVIQASPFFHNQSMVATPGSGNSSGSCSWLGSGSSTSLHRSDFSDLQLARAKEASWMAGVPLTEDLVLRYRHPVPGDTAEVLARDHQRLLEMNQPKLVNDQLEKVYSELESTQISKSEESEGSAVKEATDALILLQES